MTLVLYNTATRAKETFIPADQSGDAVGLYVCGPTVYDRIHIGNARPQVVFDTLYRLLKHLYKSVTYVRNITDVDDKIMARAEERGIDIRTLTEETTAQYHQDVDDLLCLKPEVEPRATDHIPQMLTLIERLITLGHAYEAEGHVLFDTQSWPDYGKFSNRNRDEQIEGARVEVAPYKRDPADFVLWKPSAPDQQGWESPFGYGRPGWHIECSAMSSEYLGPDFDIHGGGVDLVFPHHQNEIAQSCCGNPGSSFARYWMHNGYLMSEGEKMSKSLGNFYTVRELLDAFPGEAMRLVLLKTQYRQPMDFSKAKIREAKAELDRLYGALRDGQVVPNGELEGAPAASVVAALSDDLNTPEALAALHALRDDPATLKASAALLGLLQQDPEAWFKGEDSADGLSEAQINAFIAERIEAKKAKDFARADQIRDDLKAQGVVLEDRPGSVTDWRRV